MAQRFRLHRNHRIRLRASLLLPLLAFLYASACSPLPSPTPFIPPTNPAPLISPTLIIRPTPTEPPPLQVIPLPTIIPTADQSNCTNNLTFLADLTIPDNSFIPFGAVIDKQWQVENSGTCNWTADYRLRHVGGAALGAPEEIALYPAKAGAQAIIQINFTAPFTEGIYESAWQAFDPAGQPFGDLIYIRILVSP